MSLPGSRYVVWYYDWIAHKNAKESKLKIPCIYDCHTKEILEAPEIYKNWMDCAKWAQGRAQILNAKNIEAV